jgi:hypothetical protein
MSSNIFILVLALFLLAILIYSSVAQFDVSARKPKQINNFCNPSTPTITGAVKAETCCQAINGVYTFCIKCQYDANDNTVGSCISFYPSHLAANSTGLPTPAGNALPPPGSDTGPTIKVPPGVVNALSNATNALPPGNSTGTLPPGSIIKVPPGTIGSATNPPPTNNNTGNHIAMTSSDNPPGCSKKVPIPPNCTLNPFNNSASNKGTASLGNIIKVPVNHTNGLPTNNNTGTAPPALKLSQPTLAGQQPQTQQTTGHHHHKGSNTGASTSGGNSTGH